MKRTEMREHIFRMVFSYEFNSDQEMPQQMQLYFEQLDQEPKEEDMAYIRDKALNVILKSEEIDEMLNEHVTGWKTSRMNKGDLSILRLAVYEMKYDEDITSDEFALMGINTTLHSAKPSFANHKMFKKELGENYVIASCYNGLLLGGGSYTLCRLILGNIAKRAKDKKDFFENQLPYVMERMALYMDERIRFEVEESGFFESNFLAKEGFIHRDRFTAMFGMVGMAECVNILMELEGKKGRFGHDKEADDLGVEIMEAINAFNNAHVNPYCEATGGHFLLHAQVGIAQDKNITPGTRIPIGEEPKELIDQLRHCSRFHKYFPSGTGDIFPVDVTVHKNPQFVLDIVKGAFQADLRYLSFYESDGDVIRVTGYLAKRSEIEKYQKGESVLQNTTQLATGATENGHVQERRIR